MFEFQEFAHSLTQTDGIGAVVLGILALMSVVTWYLIALKIWQNRLLRTRGGQFLDRFRQICSLGEAERLQQQVEPIEPFGRLLEQGLVACRQLNAPGDRCGFEINSPDDFISAALQRCIANESRRLDSGLPMLASVGSTAPFVGLFGTVWGIYHALIAISLGGQAGLDQVAGPVGKALIMTACGLAVAIPAVLAYNAFVRVNRNRIGELENVAHDVFTLLGLGRIDTLAGPFTRYNQRSEAKLVVS